MQKWMEGSFDVAKALIVGMKRAKEVTVFVEKGGKEKPDIAVVVCLGEGQLAVDDGEIFVIEEVVHFGTIEVEKGVL